jgi:hypothetical protein
MSTPLELQVVPNHLLEPQFDSEEKRALQKLAAGTVDAAVDAVQPQLDQLNQLLQDLTVDPVPFRFVATPGQTNFVINGVAADSGELVLVHRNGTYLHPVNDYTTSFTIGPETTTITLGTPANLNDVIAGFVYNIISMTGGGGGGASTLDQLTDVVILNPQLGDTIKWNPALSRWENAPDATGGATGTNITHTASATDVTVESSSGLDTTIPAANGTLAGVMSAAQATKLAGIQAGATQNATDAALRDRATHTGTQASSTIASASQRVLGRSTAGSGAVEELTLGSNLTLVAGVLNSVDVSAPDFVLQSYGVI